MPLTVFAGSANVPLAAPAQLPFPVQRVSLAPLLAEAMRRLHALQSLGDLIMPV